MRGLGCPNSGNCTQCPNAARPAGMSGLGAFYDSWPAPFNNPLVLLAAAAVALLLLGGGLSFSRRGKGGSGRRNKLRLVQAKADLERAKLLAA
jgi:hypothetical protein